MDEALADNPHLEFYRLPSYSPQLNPVERLWNKLRRRATHNRLFDALADLKMDCEFVKGLVAASESLPPRPGRTG